MELKGYIKRIEEIKFTQGKLEDPENRKIDKIASIAISNEDAALAALRHDTMMASALHEMELVEQRLGIDPAIQGGILNIF